MLVKHKNHTHREQSRTHREEELLDLLHGVCHAQVGLGHGGKHLDEHVQLHGQVRVLGLAAFPQPLLLKNKGTGASASQNGAHGELQRLNELCRR